MVPQSTDAPIAFSQRLQRLKQQGCTLLVVGSVPESVLSMASHQMFGDPNLRRYRLFVLTGADTVTSRNWASSATFRSDDERTTILNCAHTARSKPPHTTGCSVDTDSTPSDRLPEIVVSPDELSTLRQKISTSISTFEDNARELTGGDLRVGFDSLRPLLENHDMDDVFCFCHRVAVDIRGARGMGHFRLPVERADDSVEALAPLFDALIELRTTNDSNAQERWHFPEDGVVTDWIAL